MQRDKISREEVNITHYLSDKDNIEKKRSMIQKNYLGSFTYK